MSHGTSTNYEFKVGIRDIRPASEVPGSEYGTFSVIVRRVDTAQIPYSIFGQGVQDSDLRPNIVEEFQGVNLDPNSPNYIKRVIGDKYITVDANGKLTSNGDYPNASAHIRVEVELTTLRMVQLIQHSYRLDLVQLHHLYIVDIQLTITNIQCITVNFK